MKWGDAIKSVYFGNSGMISILSVFPNGKSVEVGLVGRKASSDFHCWSASAPRRPAPFPNSPLLPSEWMASLTSLLPQCPVLERSLQQYSQIFTMEITQIAACNRLHEVEERLARWLLMCADRIDSWSGRSPRNSSPKCSAVAAPA